MTVDINHADGLGAALPAVCPEVEGRLPCEVGVKVAIVRRTHEAFGVVPLDQLIVGIPTDAAIFPLPGEAVRANQLFQEGANWVFGSFCLRICD